MNGRTKTENTENKDILTASTKKNRGRKREDGQRDVKPQQRPREEPTEPLPENHTKKSD